MKNRLIVLVCLLVFSSLPIRAALITPAEWTYYIDGVVSDSLLNDPSPVTGTLLDCLGTLTWSTSVAGSHNFIAFFDYEIDEEINHIINETGWSHGTLSTEQSWEIGEPGYAFGDIYTNVLSGSLDNTNGLEGLTSDASVALGWSFSLNELQTALIALMITDVAPTSGFYLQQYDPDSHSSVYFSSTLTISEPSASPVPEPGTMLLLGCGIIGLSRFGRRLGT